MDEHGYVLVKQLINGVRNHSSYEIDENILEKIVAEDNKGRYRFDDTHEKIKCCQGHTVSYVIPEMTYCEPPCCLYHGTTESALRKIEKSGAILKMRRHDVHMQAEESKAWQSAERWNLVPVVLKIDAESMSKDGYRFGVTENHVWCTERVPFRYIVEILKSSPHKDGVD
jgi:putative RNA 2'-phosphotransferase